MNANDILPPAPSAPESGASGEAAGDAWPTSGPAKGMRVRLPIAIASLAVVALVGAAGGAALKHSSPTTTQAGAISNNRATGAAGANGAGRFGGAGGGVFGTVSKVNGDTITVTQADGSTATVVVPSGTTISKTVSGSLADLTTGTSIVVRGTTADGKTTAQSVTITPPGGAGGFGAGGFGGRNTRPTSP